MKHKKIIYRFAISLLLLFAACTFNEPVLPNWQTLWELPLPEISYEMSDAIDNEFIFADTTSQGIPILSLSIADSIEKEGIMVENLAIKPEPETLATTIESIKIDSPGKESSTPISIHELLGFSVQPGDTINIPPNTFLNLPAQNIIFSNFYYVMVNNGKLILEFHNQTLLEIASGMQIDIYDDSTNQFIGTSTFPIINSYTSVFANDSIDLSNNLISRRFRLESQVPLVPGIYPVLESDTSGYIQTDVHISNLIVEEALANIPQQSVNKIGTESVEDRDNRVIEAVIEKGQIELFIENQLEVEATVIVTLPNFEEQNGQTFSTSELIPASDSTISTINLDGLKMYNFLSPGQLIDSLYYEVTVQTTPTSGITHLSNRDSVIVRFEADSIYFSEFEGEIDTVTVDIDTIQQGDIFDYNGFEGGISLDDIKLDITIYNEIGIPVDMLLFVRGEHRNNTSGEVEKYLEMDPININVLPGETGTPSVNIVELNAANSKIVELMQILPTDIIISGISEIMGQGRVTLEDSVWGEYTIHSPFNVFVDSIPDFESDIELLDEFDQELKDAINNRFQETILKLNYENGLPLAANVILIFATDTINFFEIDTSDTNKLILSDFVIPSGTLGSDDYVSVPSSGLIVPQLSEQEIKIFTNEELYFGSKIVFPETNTRMKFRSTDAFIGIGAVQIKVFMNPEND